MECPNCNHTFEVEEEYPPTQALETEPIPVRIQDIVASSAGPIPVKIQSGMNNTRLVLMLATLLTCFLGAPIWIAWELWHAFHGRG
jgi:hypothetical protein